MVLFVDDDTNILHSLSRLFRKEEYVVDFASSGPDALKLIASMRHVAVIISDQKMPGMDGVHFLQHSRELAPQAIRIFMTGYANNTDTINAINDGGVTRYISKPWEDSELLQIVRNAVFEYCFTTMRNNPMQQYDTREHSQHSYIQGIIGVLSGQMAPEPPRPSSRQSGNPLEREDTAKTTDYFRRWQLKSYTHHWS